MRNPWERQPKESEQAFEAFETYCNMGKSRSLVKVSKELGKSKELMERWSSRWHWVLRAEEYDNELKRMEMEEKRKAIAEMCKRQSMTGKLMQKKAVEALKDIAPEMLTIKNIVDLIEIGAKLEREATLYGIEEKEQNNPEEGDGLVIINDTTDSYQQSDYPAVLQDIQRQDTYTQDFDERPSRHEE